ncbi:ATP synthase subunit a [Thiomicrorhabdus immobilis]|uniref:ATP synthase subunit a n=1 Tax=Thiomicrorhabdus immobilis TaxID=2791037 RepID=A0ABM7MFD1_9GAMM|nr:F0F1 ATP synthase subunit A [Thiomicrorhabdus immobilis]BCN94093.1 ATP synthase subunit a [Thiomicrorhabdus immobilis]
MQSSGLDISILFEFAGIQVTNTVATTWGIMLFLGVCVWLANRLWKTPESSIEQPITERISANQAGTYRLPQTGLQTFIEGIVTTIQSAVASVAPQHVKELTPFIGSLWLFILCANLIGLIPGLHSPTRDFSATAALAVLVFLSVHWFGVRILGWKAYLKHYLSPSPILLPFNLISEISRTIALSVRLFGNMMSLEMTALLILMVAGFLAPVPILMLHIIEALVQAYIFGILALVYIAGGIQSHQRQQVEQADSKTEPQTEHQAEPSRIEQADASAIKIRQTETIQSKNNPKHHSSE